MTTWSATVLARATDAFERARDPERAAPMSAYLRNQFVFYGIPTPARVALSRQVVADLDRPDEHDLVALADAAWARPEREHQYLACWLLRRHHSVLTPAFLPTARRAITTRSWWDTVDVLAAHVVGWIVHEHRELEQVMGSWLVDDDLWLARTSLLHQLAWKDDTDPDVLFAACLTRAADTEFFLRKAIGWALRSYSTVDPAAVERFVADHADQLSGLSRREALKAIERRRSRSG